MKQINLILSYKIGKNLFVWHVFFILSAFFFMKDCLFAVSKCKVYVS